MTSPNPSEAVVTPAVQTIWRVMIDRDWGMRGTRRYFVFFMREKVSNDLLLEKIRFLKPEFNFHPDAEQAVHWQQLMLSEVGAGFAMYEESR